MFNIENTLEGLREDLIDNIYGLFDKHCKKDNLGDMSIQSGEISDESLYLLCGFEPEWNDDIEDEVLYPCEIVEFWENINEIDVKTFEKGSIHIKSLDLDDLLRCYEYLMCLEDETKE